MKDENIRPSRLGHMADIFKGKVALVTGGTGAIGSALCTYLADYGSQVASTYRNEPKARDWQHEMKDKGYDFAIYPCDVGNLEDCQTLASAIRRDFGGLDILVNNAGITRDTTFRKMSFEQWKEVINTNLDSVCAVTLQFIDGMMERGWGRVINISSINGQKGQFGQANYSAAKAGMHGFSMALAQEVARKGVTVNTISPGYIATDMVLSVAEDVRNKIIGQIPVGRLGKPEEIAAVVGFLASPAASFITGSNIAANGGQHMF